MVDQDAWMNRFANLWLAYHREQETIHSIEPVTEKQLDNPSKDIIADNIEPDDSREEWLRSFAELWLACEKDPAALLKNRITPTNIKQMEGSKENLNPELSPDMKTYQGEIAAEVSKGKIVIADFAPDEKVPDLNPDDVIVFDINPEQAIKLLTSTRNGS
ncbi:MAG: hypothetical protein ACE5FU_09635 [Nitrospinota bacterium]